MMDGAFTLCVTGKGQLKMDLRIRSKQAFDFQAPEENVWERFLKAPDKYWIEDSSISVTPFVYPDSYYLEYRGEEQRVKDLFDKKGLGGNYTKQNMTHKDVPYYVKEDDQDLFLHRGNTKRWAISSTLDDNYGFLHQTGHSNFTPAENSKWYVTGSAINIRKKEVSLIKNIQNDKRRENEGTGEKGENVESGEYEENGEIKENGTNRGNYENRENRQIVVARDIEESKNMGGK